MNKIIVVAGATGNLGTKISRELVKRGAEVKALVRETINPEKINTLTDLGVKIIKVDLNNQDEIAQASTGASCVVSALAGLKDVIVDLQKNILDGALQAGVPRFIPSDFCTDYHNLVPGENRNFDLRREFKNYLDSTAIQASSIFNGCFADILKYNTPLLNLKNKSISYWGDKADWKIDFTTTNDTAAFTAQVALDDSAPRNLQIASFQVSPQMIWQEVEQTSGQNFKFFKISSLEDFASFIKKQRAENPTGENELYANWQQSQYIYSMFTTQQNNLANKRYPNLTWTTSSEYIGSFVQ